MQLIVVRLLSVVEKLLGRLGIDYYVVGNFDFRCKKIPCSQEQGVLGTQKKGGGRVSVFLFFLLEWFFLRKSQFFDVSQGLSLESHKGGMGNFLAESGGLTLVSQFRRFEQEGKANKRICALGNLCCFLGNIVI